MTSTGALNTASDKVRVMLVEDSAVIRGMVRRWLENVPGIEVVDSASNGQVAIDMTRAIKPDIIILDIEMPVMDGLTALPQILRAAPDVKVLIASTLSRRNAEVTLKAMSLGASDFVAKPSFVRDGNDARAQFQEELVRKVTGLAAATGRGHRDALTFRAAEDWRPVSAADARITLRKPSPVTPRVLAIGASTGGPAALAQVIEDAKSALGQVPVLIAQHMPPTFTALLGEKLSRIAGLPGGEAVHGEPVVAGRIYVAPGGQHMRVKSSGSGFAIALDTGPPVNHCRPAVDPLFSSIADAYSTAALAVVLTGMGSDGARGAVEIADAGGTVLVQDEPSSIVWGMPGATATAGAASAIVGLTDIGDRISRTLCRGGGA